MKGYIHGGDLYISDSAMVQYNISQTGIVYENKSPIKIPMWLFRVSEWVSKSVSVFFFFGNGKKS